MKRISVVNNDILLGYDHDETVTRTFDALSFDRNRSTTFDLNVPLPTAKVHSTGMASGTAGEASLPGSPSLAVAVPNLVGTAARLWDRTDDEHARCDGDVAASESQPATRYATSVNGCTTGESRPSTWAI